MEDKSQMMFEKVDPWVPFPTSHRQLPLSNSERDLFAHSLKEFLH